MRPLNARNHELDPGPNELRIISPMLLREKNVVEDMEGGSATPDNFEECVMIYFPVKAYSFFLYPFIGRVMVALNVYTSIR